MRSSTDLTPPPWVEALLERLGYLEAREAERSGQEEAATQDAAQVCTCRGRFQFGCLELFHFGLAQAPRDRTLTNKS